MKTIIKAILFSTVVLMSAKASALAYYDGMWPDETSPTGLPEAIPCNFIADSRAYTPNGHVACTWMVMPRQIAVWDQQRQLSATELNQYVAVCRNGKCQSSGHYVGNYPENANVVVSAWYYLGESSDGAPIAYLHGHGPGFGKQAVSYAQAGKLLHDFYVSAGVDNYDAVKHAVGVHYRGGWDKYKADQQGPGKTTALVATETVKSAWCNPRMDDDCYINSKSVARADLPKYLPLIDEATAERQGGFCEYPICYDGNGTPIGLRKTSYQ